MTAPEKLLDLDEIESYYANQYAPYVDPLIGELVQECRRQREEIAALREYVDFLSGDPDGVYAFAFAHGWKGDKLAMERGDRFRANIGRTEDGKWEKP